MNRKTRLVQIGVVLLAIAAPGVAVADDKARWEFEAEPYGWLSGNYGSVTVKGTPHTHISVTPSDLYGLLEDGNAFAAAGYFSAMARPARFGALRVLAGDHLACESSDDRGRLGAARSAQRSRHVWSVAASGRSRRHVDPHGPAVLVLSPERTYRRSLA
jgi:hypothetical protein